MNEITISDLTSLADTDSIRVSGTTDGRPARINDLTIDHASNPYTTDDASDTDSDDESETDEESESLQALQTALTETENKICDIAERRASAEQELALLQQYASNLAASQSTGKVDPETMKKTLELYNAHRALHYGTITSCAAEDIKLQAEYMKKNKALEKERRAHAKTLRAKTAAWKKKQAEKQERRKEKDEQRPEISAQVLRVRITIEIPSYDTSAPGTAANSTDKELPDVPDSDNVHEGQLTLSYTTSAASWTPMYDLRLDTLNPAMSTLTYRAHFTNRTYETWTQASITLSTSQASFGGLNEKIPQMESWRVTAGRKWEATNSRNGDNGLYSLAEIKVKEAEQEQSTPHAMSLPGRVGNSAMPTRKHKKSANFVPTPMSIDRLGLRAMPQASYAAMRPTVIIQPETATYARDRSPSRERRRSPSRERRRRSRRSHSPRRERSPAGYGGYARGMRSSDSSGSRSRSRSPIALQLGDEETLAPAKQAMQHTLAGADTYGCASFFCASSLYLISIFTASLQLTSFPQLAPFPPQPSSAGTSSLKFHYHRWPSHTSSSLS